MEHNGKPIHLAHVTDFKHLFSTIEKPKIFVGEPGQVEISSFLQIRDAEGRYHSAHIKPSRKVVNLIREKMLPIVGGVFFSIVDHGNGKALVIVGYNSILGSRYMAYINSKTIPK